MQCPYCNTENRIDRERCYACERDLSMLRLIVNKARHHYNQGLEHAERGRLNEAIDELHNAIDLDRRFIPAHVVLGTLEAKRGNFEKAREAWEAALGLSPEIQKAHNYLQKSTQVESCLPTVRNLQFASGLLLLIAIFLTVLLVFVRQKDESAALLKSARAAYADKKYATALAELDRAAAMPTRWEAVPAAAQALKASIESDMAQQLRNIKELKYAGKYAESLEAISRLEALEPDGATSATLASDREDINRYFRMQIEQLFKDFAENRTTLAELTENISEYLAMYPELPDKSELRDYLEAARSIEVETRVAALREGYQSSRDMAAVLNGLDVLGSEFPGLDAVAVGRGQIVDDLLTDAFGRFQSLLDGKAFPDAARMLAQAEAVAAEFEDIVDVSGPINLSRQLLLESMQTARLESVEELARNGDPAEAEDAIVDVMIEEGLTTGELQLVDLLIRTVDQRELSRLAQSVLADYSDFQRLRMEDTLTTATFESLDRMLATVDDLSARDRNRLVACAAASAIKLDKATEAESLIGRLEEAKGDRQTITNLRRLLRSRTQ